MALIGILTMAVSHDNVGGASKEVELTIRPIFKEGSYDHLSVFCRGIYVVGGSGPD